MDPVGVGNVYNLLVGAEADAVGPAESICHGANATGCWVEAVDLVGQPRARAYALLPAVDGVCEPYRAVRVHDDVVGRVEGAAVEGGDEQLGLVVVCGAVWPRPHEDYASGLVEGALGTEQHAVSVVYTTVGQEDILCINLPVLCIGAVGFGRQPDSRDKNVGLARHWVGVLVTGDEETVVLGYEDASLVGKGALIIFQQQVELGLRAKDLVCCFIVNLHPRGRGSHYCRHWRCAKYVRPGGVQLGSAARYT